MLNRAICSGHCNRDIGRGSTIISNRITACTAIKRIVISIEVSVLRDGIVTRACIDVFNICECDCPGCAVAVGQLRRFGDVGVDGGVWFGAIGACPPRPLMDANRAPC